MILLLTLHLTCSLVVFCWLADENDLTHAAQLPLWVLVANAWPVFVLTALVRLARSR